MDDLNQKLLEDGTDAMNELSDNIKDYEHTDEPIKGKKANIFVILFCYLLEMFAIVVVFTNLIKLKPVWGWIATLVSILVGANYFMEKNKDKTYKYNKSSRYLALGLIILGVLIAFVGKYLDFKIL